MLDVPLVASDGTCRFNAPAPRLTCYSRVLALRAEWPTVRADDWCAKLAQAQASKRRTPFGVDSL